MANKKRNPERPTKRYPTDMYVDQVVKIDEIATQRSEAVGKSVSRATILKEIVDSGLKKYE